MRYTVFDVETPNEKNDRICSISLVYIVDNKIVGAYSSYVNPQTRFNQKNTQIHGITDSMVADSPTFDIVWQQIKDDFENNTAIAHNATFDLSVLCKTLTAYGLDVPELNYICTCNLAKSLETGAENNRLNTLCDCYNIDLFQHHDAECDAKACAELFLCLCDKFNLNPKTLYKRYNYCPCVSRPISKRTIDYTAETQSLQLLQGILIGIISDNVLNENEVLSLNNWLRNNTHLSGNYPFDRVFEVVSNVLEDNVISQQELNELLCLFNQFVNPSESFSEKCEIISLDGKYICLTGDFESASRLEVQNKLVELGATVKGMSKQIDYLVIGSLGSEQYANGNYGTKTKKAIEFNDKGASIAIIQEKEFIKATGIKI